ncbi:peptidoglycan hydrolase-like protein with peptidoglycan-binding domain [Bosea sp. BE125]|uniref:peptidoglycan-binding domain-containing protein n=1 Tax=Bosea sp. BE125 TaxID=2817909 RepID=UPI002864D609|nr:peptidoglycan-binding domain-containing protein [Bosea sp. BE125]MDR6870104.1 peptidoglycan hydrolase-like protein with peptidoglycan-binding domain [Bosea sp. BE125]
MLSLGDKNDAVRSLQEMLNFLHFKGRMQYKTNSPYIPLEIDGVFGPDTEDAVLDFQRENNLYADGRVGPITLHQLESDFSRRSIELTSPAAIPQPDSLTIETYNVDAYEEGYKRVRLRSDTMMAFIDVAVALRRAGGLMTSSGGIRSLDTPVNANRSATSLHYSGRAHDLYVWAAMQNPDKDPYVAQRLGDRRYRVFARCWPERAEDGALPPQTTIKDVVTYQQRSKGVAATGHFIDLTALFDSAGFKPIRARQSFEAGGDRLGAEWWHFQWEKGLVPGVSTFGDELLKIYTKPTLEKYPPWVYRSYVWQKDWF